MTHFGARNGQSISSGSDPSGLARMAGQAGLTLSADQVAPFLFAVPRGSVVALGGLDLAILTEMIDCSENIPSNGRALFVQVQRAANAEAYVEQVISALADTAKRLWPLWFGDVNFVMCRDDVLGREAAGAIVRKAADGCPEINPAWGDAAARLALAGRQPRVVGAARAVELAQLSSAISRAKLILVLDVNAAADTPTKDALVHALEWIARHSLASVVALFASLPPLGSSFDRILYGAHRVVLERDFEPSVSEAERGEGIPEAWLAPWRGAPHPLSEIEQRLARMLGDDDELRTLFHFNWFVDTVRGSRPKVDLVWMKGRLVIELDGYPDHTTRRAFIDDRNRDYELALSGYTVLRLANDDVLQDFGRAVEKIRDLVRLRQSQMNRED
jgi:very-short-patch-repair endonuclease